MNTFIHNRKLYLWIVGLIALFQTACTETEYLEYEQEAANRILEYRVTNSPETLLGAINNTNNTITIYIPYYLSIDFIVPEIELEDDAVLLDGNGDEINMDGGVDPVSIASTGYTYTVKDANGQIRNYQLVIKILAYGEPLYTGYTLTEDGEPDTVSTYERVIGAGLYIYGNFQSTSENFKFTFTHQGTGVVSTDILSPTSVEPYSEGLYRAAFSTNVAADTGHYDVVVEHQGRSFQMPALRLFYQKNPVTVAALSSQFNQATPGDTITYTINLLGNPVYPNSYFGNIPAITELYMLIPASATVPDGFPEEMLNIPIQTTIVSNTATEVKFLVPDIPAGTYLGSTTATRVKFYYSFSDWTGWGSDNLFAYATSMYILEKDQ